MPGHSGIGSGLDNSECLALSCAQVKKRINDGDLSSVVREGQVDEGIEEEQAYRMPESDRTIVKSQSGNAERLVTQ